MKLIKLWETDLKKAYELQSSFDLDENGFMNPAFGYTYEQFLAYVKACEGYSKGEGLPEGYVPDTRFVLEDDAGNYVGIFNLRHRLNDFLANGPGHIGYGISKDHRRKGYASKGLALALEEAKKVGIKVAYLSANLDNEGSIKAQLKNGAVIHHTDEGHYYTRISCQISAGGKGI